MVSPFFSYHPFFNTGNVTYIYRGLICILLFFTMPLCLMIQIKRCYMELIIFIIGSVTVLYFIFIVGNRPYLDKICDRDEALDIALKSIFSGEYPYLLRTHLGGPITSLTSSFILALPGWLLFDRSDVSSIIWIIFGGIYFYLYCVYFKKERWAYLILFCYFFSPALIYNMVLASDLPWFSIFLIVALYHIEKNNIFWGVVFLYMINLMLRMIATCARPGINRLQAHLAHQTPHSFSSNRTSAPLKFRRHSRDAIKRQSSENLIDLAAQRIIRRVRQRRLIVER